MALPSSGQISLSHSRSEMSQSALNNYSLTYWAFGYSGGNNVGVGPTNYAPINILSSGSRWSPTKKLDLANLSMSAWYEYDHNAYISTGVTGTLYEHANAGALCYVQTMLPIDLGTTNATFSINISGTLDSNGRLSIGYAKPWAVNGGSNLAFFNSTFYDNGISNQNTTITYNYTYNAASGSKIYCVVWGSCP